MPAEVDHREKQVAIFLDPVIVGCGLVQFLKLFQNLVARPCGVGPVEPDARRPLLELFGAFQRGPGRSEEHTSELQSLMRISYAVFCLKKKTKTTSHQKTQCTN